MTREEAIGEITYLVYSNQETMGSAKLQDALRVIKEFTRNPVPDPDTGLVPCGCGGKPMHMVWPDENFPNGLRRYVICGKCMTETSGFNETNGQAANRWNHAMGLLEVDDD